MKNLIHKTMAVTLAAAFACTFILMPTPASARYHDHSDELPGIDFNPTPYLVVGGVVLAASVIYLIAKHDSKPATGTAKPPVMPDSGKSESAVRPTAPHQKPATEPQASDTTTVIPVAPEKDSRLNLYIGLTNDRVLYHSDAPAMDFSDYTVRAGVTIGF